MKWLLKVFFIIAIYSSCSIPQKGDKYYSYNTDEVETVDSLYVTLYWLIAIGTVVGLMTAWKNSSKEDHSDREWGTHLQKDTPENRIKWQAAAEKYKERIYKVFGDRRVISKEELRSETVYLTNDRNNMLERIWSDNYLIEPTVGNKNFYRIGRILTNPSFMLEKRA